MSVYVWRPCGLDVTLDIHYIYGWCNLILYILFPCSNCQSDWCQESTWCSKLLFLRLFFTWKDCPSSSSWWRQHWASSKSSEEALRRILYGATPFGSWSRILRSRMGLIPVDNFTSQSMIPCGVTIMVWIFGYYANSTYKFFFLSVWWPILKTTLNLTIFPVTLTTTINRLLSS